MDNFNFDDDEPKKKKKVKSKKGKKKRTVQSREFYETQLTGLNGRLADLRSRFLIRNEDNRKLAQELVTIEEDRADVCEYLERSVKNRRASIIELHDTLKKLEIQRDEYKEWSQQRIAELQKQFNEDHKQLQTEIVLQKKTLVSLDAFRLARDATYSQFEEHNEGIATLERQVKEDLYNMEQKAVIQKNILKKEVEDKLDYLVKDFLRSYEIRNAGYTRSLIRENIVLTNRLDKLVKQNVRTMEEREKQYLKTKEIMESYTSLEQLSEQLRRTIANKNDIIEQLTARIDRMRMKYIDARRFRRLHDFAKSRNVFDKNAPRNFDEVVHFLERLNNEKNAIIQQQRVQESEIVRMRHVLDTLQVAVERTIYALQQLGPGESLDPTDRRAIINELIFLTISESLEKTNTANTAAVYHQGECGLIPREYLDNLPLNLLFARSVVNPEYADKSDVSSYRAYNMSSFHAFSNIDECAVEQIGDGFGSYQNRIKAKERLKNEWLKIDLLADSIKTADQFKKCFEDIPSCMVMDCNTDFKSSTDPRSTQENGEDIYPIEKQFQDPMN